MHLIDWARASEAGPEVAGGKGWNLGRLHRYGFLVPAGGVVTAGAYRTFLERAGLQEQAASFGSVPAEEAAAPETGQRLNAFREAILAAPLPGALVAELKAFLEEQDLTRRSVAVRSSATAEDSATASFAGIHQSYLNVTGSEAVAEALKGCYASLWSPQALAYRRRLGLSDERVAAAVVILAMVPARAAGVGFSCDPRSGRMDRLAISATRGLGEALVSGTAEPDEYLLDITQYPPSVVQQRVGRKEQMTVYKEGGGTRLERLAPAEAARPALTVEQLQELAYLIARVHDALGGLEQPQDIEWVHDGVKFWLVQARPVTNLPPATFPEVADQPVIWSNANLKDVMPGVQSALGWSFMRSGIDVLLAAPLQAGGYPYAGGMNWARLVGGRAYFNLSALQWAYYDAIGLTPDEFNRVLGGHQPEISVPAATWRDRVRRELARLRLIRRTMQVMQRAKADFRRLWDWAEQAEAEPFDQYSPEQLLTKMLEIKGLMEDFLPRFQLMNSGAGGTHQELIKLLEPAFGERAPGLVNAMMAGSTGITSAEQGIRLVQLGNLALQEERIRAYFTAPDWAPGAWQTRLAGTRFHAEFVAYLREYGHRGVYELEPMNPRWKEDPTYLLETVRSQVISGREIRLEGQAAKRQAAYREVFGKLGFGLNGLKGRYFLKQAIQGAALREMAKSIVVKVAGIARYAALAVGRRLTAAELLAEPADVFHLSWVDLEAYLKDRPCASGFRALVADRKALRERHLAQDPPDVIVGESAMKKAPPPEATGPVLTGLGVASGQASGTCRVIRHPDEGSRLQPGEVLVAPSTDPAWTPLFLRASAIVMEVGGYLSHGAIVAREYGLPAVVNIPGLLQTLADGERVTVDGDLGKVYRQQE